MAAGDSEYPGLPMGMLTSSQRWALTTAPKSRTSVEPGAGGPLVSERGKVTRLRGITLLSTWAPPRT